MILLSEVSHPNDLSMGGISPGWLNYWQYVIRMTYGYCSMSPGWDNYVVPKSSGWLSYRQYLIRLTYQYYRMSSVWLTILSYLIHDVIWTLSHPDELAPGRISSGWVLNTAVYHPDDIYRHMSSGWLSWNWYLIRMSYDNVIMSSGWHTLPFLCLPDEIPNFDFPYHAVALQRFCRIMVDQWCNSFKVHHKKYVYC